MVSGQVASSQCRGRAAGKGPISPLTSDEAKALKTHINSAPADAKVALFRIYGRDSAINRQGHCRTDGRQKGIDHRFDHGLSVEAPRAASTILRGQEVFKQEPR
jgi:hypothetical protein